MRKLIGVFGPVIVVLAGCTSTYYSAWEKLGWHKRDILVSRVQKARDSQQEVKEQFQTTLEKFKAVTGFKGGDLEAKYNSLKAEYDQCEKRAEDVKSRIESVDSVAKELFTEWEKELSEYKSGELKHKSEEELRTTKARYQQLLATMKRAESKMTPVLQAFHDQVLFIKHNLNAKAIASLESTTVALQGDVDRLIQDMQRSIDESPRPPAPTNSTPSRSPPPANPATLKNPWRETPRKPAA